MDWQVTEDSTGGIYSIPESPDRMTFPTAITSSNPLSCQPTQVSVPASCLASYMIASGTWTGPWNPSLLCLLSSPLFFQTFPWQWRIPSFYMLLSRASTDCRQETDSVQLWTQGLIKDEGKLGFILHGKAISLVSDKLSHASTEL